MGHRRAWRTVVATCVAGACHAGAPPAPVPLRHDADVAARFPEDPVFAAVAGVRLGMRMSDVRARRPALALDWESDHVTERIAEHDVRYVRRPPRTGAEFMRVAMALGRVPPEAQVLDAVEYTWGSTDSLPWRPARPEPRRDLVRRLHATVDAQAARRGAGPRCVRYADARREDAGRPGERGALLYWPAGTARVGYHIVRGPRETLAVLAFVTADTAAFQDGPRHPVITAQDMLASMREASDLPAPTGADSAAFVAGMEEETRRMARDQIVRTVTPAPCARALDGL